jgi:hypothetical protein
MLKLTVKMINVDEFGGPMVSYVRGEIEGIIELERLVTEYLENSTELDLKDGESCRQITLTIDKEKDDSGYGYYYYLRSVKPPKISRYSKRQLAWIEARKQGKQDGEGFPF